MKKLLLLFALLGSFLFVSAQKVNSAEMVFNYGRVSGTNVEAQDYETRILFTLYHTSTQAGFILTNPNGKKLHYTFVGGWEDKIRNGVKYSQAQIRDVSDGKLYMFAIFDDVDYGIIIAGYGSSVSFYNK